MGINKDMARVLRRNSSIVEDEEQLMTEADFEVADKIKSLTHCAARLLFRRQTLARIETQTS